MEWIMPSLKFLLLLLLPFLNESMAATNSDDGQLYTVPALSKTYKLLVFLVDSSDHYKLCTSSFNGSNCSLILMNAHR